MTNIPLTVPVKVSVQDLTYKVNVSTAIQVLMADFYEGSYEVTPSLSEQVLETNGKVMDNDVTVHAMKEGLATLPIMSFVADPNISFDKTTGKITATVSGNEEITPLVEEGYISEGTPGKIGYFGNKTLKLNGLSGGTIRPRLYGDYTVRKYYYLTGDYVFKSVTIDGLTADKVVEGNVVRIGDELDPEHIMRVEGTAVVPSGTKQVAITKNGTVTEDVTGYANAEINVNVPASAVDTGTKNISSNGTHDVIGYESASVNVPNSYSASDEGKVVSNGALVAQTSDTVTENGTVDTTLIDELTVNVPTGGGFDIDDFIDHTKPQGAFTTTAASIITQTFRERTGITSLSAPNCTTIGGYGFYGCTALETVDFPELKSFGASDVFSSCTKLKGFIMPKGNGTLSSTNSIFRGCSKLKYFDGGVGITKMTGINTFQNCTIFDTMVLRRTAGVTAIGTSTLNGTPFASGGTGGTLYVPQALISSYQSATNWSTILEYANNQILPIEGSQYENYYADGTPIPTE